MRKRLGVGTQCSKCHCEKRAVKFPPDASEIYYVTWIVKRTWTIQIYANWTRGFPTVFGTGLNILFRKFFFRLRNVKKLSICFAEEVKKRTFNNKERKTNFKFPSVLVNTQKVWFMHYAKLKLHFRRMLLSSFFFISIAAKFSILCLWFHSLYYSTAKSLIHSLQCLVREMK